VAGGDQGRQTLAVLDHTFWLTFAVSFSDLSDAHLSIGLHRVYNCSVIKVKLTLRFYFSHLSTLDVTGAGGTESGQKSAWVCMQCVTASRLLGPHNCIELDGMNGQGYTDKSAHTATFSTYFYWCFVNVVRILPIDNKDLLLLLLLNRRPFV
jgi:hypothetical protein